MALEVILPRVDMDMSEGKIAHWYVKNGDSVTKGQVVFEIETDKATMEIDAAADGVIQGITGDIGVTLPVGHVVAWILQPGEAVPATSGESPVQFAEAAQAAGLPSAAPVAVPDQADEAVQTGQTVTTLLRATPLARTLSREQGVDLTAIRGTGPDGRILAADVAGFAAKRELTKAARSAGGNDNLHLHWFERGTGAPLVLLHGFGTSLGSWRPLAEQLGGLSLLGIDLPNHGKSPRLAVTSLADIAQAVQVRLDAEGIGDIHLLGHSMGGGAAIALGGLLGPRLRSLTMLAPAGLGPEINGAFVQGLVRATREDSLRPWLSQLFVDQKRLTSSFSASAWHELESSSRREALAELAACLLPDGTQTESLRGNLDGLEVPLKVVWGLQDRIIPVGQSAGLPGTVALHLLDGVGHLPQVEAVPLLARLVRQQLASGEAVMTASRKAA